MVIFWLILAMILKSQSNDFDVIAHAGAPLGEWPQNFREIVRTVFEKFETFVERSGGKRYDCISFFLSSRIFSPTPKKLNFF